MIVERLSTANSFLMLLMICTNVTLTTTATNLSATPERSADLPLISTNTSLQPPIQINTSLPPFRYINAARSFTPLRNNESIYFGGSPDEYCLAHRNSFVNLLTGVLYSFVCIVGLFGNTLVIYVVLRYSKMQTVTNIYILNLAIADECFLIGIPFLVYTMRICSWKFGEYMCKIYMVSTSITQFTSSIFLLIMSADRYIAICHPISSPRYRTLHIAKLVSAFAWLTSAVLMLPVILFASTVSQEDGINYSCNIEWPDAHTLHSGTTFILYTFALGFATPLCFILCFYYLVIRKLHSVGAKHKSKEKRRSHRKVTRLVLTVITVYIFCWLPHWISQLTLIHSNPAQSDLTRLQILVFLLLGCLVYSNSAINPILYAFLSDNFRKSFFKAFVCMERKAVNAQLQLEPSVCTRFGENRRQRSTKMAAGGIKAQSGHKSETVKPAQNSSTTTSSTTTAERGGGGAQREAWECQNGRVSFAMEDTSLIWDNTEAAVKSSEWHLSDKSKKMQQTNL